MTTQSRTQSPLFQSLDEYELSLCLFFNSACRRTSIKRFFSVVSRLGDGILWYALILSLPLVLGTEGLPLFAHLAAMGLGNVVLYKVLKHSLGRNRPFIRHKEVSLGAPALDWYSFPSGHTLHAVAFTVVIGAAFPLLTAALVPFTILVAISRVILGLHYPSDVLAGCLIGSSVALGSLLLL
jgi:undecaprenyl-diphosphatase